MDDVSFSPMQNVGIHRTHWAIQNNMNQEKSRGYNQNKTKIQGQNK